MSIRLDDSGFTLIELLITIIITGIIVTALGSAAISILHNGNTTNQTLSQSHDAQIAAAYFANDVQSADVSGTVVPTVYSNDARCDKVGNTPVLRLAWTELDTSGNVAAYKLVVYSTEAVSGSPSILRRRFCQSTSHATLNANSVIDLQISYNVSTTTPPVYSVTTTCPDGSAKAISLTVTEQPVSGVNPYTFQVSGTRREATC